MNLRWYVHRREWWSWNSRWDQWELHATESPPELQSQDAAGTWAAVPTHTDLEPAGPEPD